MEGDEDGAEEHVAYEVLAAVSVAGRNPTGDYTCLVAKVAGDWVKVVGCCERGRGGWSVAWEGGTRGESSRILANVW